MMEVRTAATELAIVAPCPIGHEIDNGWLDRISVVDGVFHDRERIYLNFAPHHTSKEPSIARRGERVFEAFLSPNSTQHRAFVATIIEKVQTVYVHTVHYAKYVLDWLATGKVIVDIHGTVPEEEK